MTYKQLLRYYGSQAAIADASGSHLHKQIGISTVKSWQQGNPIPKKRRLIFQRDTSGQLKAS